MSSRIRIFVVDDEQDLTDLLHYQLGKEGFKVKFSNNPYEALGNARDFNPDLIILDVMMPDLNGFQLLRMIRADNLLQKTPVIMLTAKTDVEHRIKGLEQGADDYLGKPFEPKELILRIKNIINKTITTEQKRIIEFANVKIDLNKLLIIKNNNEFKINNTEKIILEKMINNPGKTFSREDIGQLIELDKERSIDVIITRLRKKIEIDPKNPKFLQTIRGAGYVLWIE